MSTENIIPSTLVDEIKHGRVVLFVGAGVSMNAGLPSWGSLLEYLGKSTLSQEKEEREFYKRSSYQEKAQYLYDISDRVNTLQKVKDYFHDTLNENHDNYIHNVIASIPVETIITTNWDDLIENAFRIGNIPYTAIWKDSQMSSISHWGKTIIKLHGTLEDADSIVFSEDDYIKSYEDNSLMKIFISTILSRATILMVGYSYQDDNFKVINEFVRKCLGRNYKKIYSLFLNESSYRLKYLESRGLRCINFTGHSKKEAIHDFFRNLYDSVSIIAHTSLERLKIVARENGEVASRCDSIVLRNMSALGPLATPENTPYSNMYGENTDLEIECAKNWRRILEKDDSSAKIILCLNDDKAREVYEKDAYISRIETLLNNLRTYENKLVVADAGSPLIMSNFDIYGTEVFLENIKTDINNMGYGHLKVHKNKGIIKANIDIFEKIFESVSALNIIEANSMSLKGINDNDLIKKLVVKRLENLLTKVKNEW